MSPWIVLCAAVALLPLAGSATAAPASAKHAAACVAALKANETGLAATLKAGAPVGEELLTVVRSGIAIIGSQYLAGLREAEARQLLKEAEKDFEALPFDAARSRQALCLQEGQSIYRSASSLERSLITKAARHRIRQLTGG